MTDTTSMTGAQFRREVAADPEKWAGAFLAAYTKAEGLHTEADRLAFVTSWMRDAMDAAAKNGIWKISARAGYGTKRSD
jgi:hypothetical protein